MASARCQTKNRVACDLRCHDSHVTLLCCKRNTSALVKIDQRPQDMTIVIQVSFAWSVRITSMYFMVIIQRVYPMGVWSASLRFVQADQYCPMFMMRKYIYLTLQWRHNELDGVSDHHYHDYLLNRLFTDQRKHQSPSSLAFFVGNSPVTGEFTAQMASNAETVHLMTSSWASTQRNEHITLPGSDTCRHVQRKCLWPKTFLRYIELPMLFLFLEVTLMPVFNYWSALWSHRV